MAQSSRISSDMDQSLSNITNSQQKREQFLTERTKLAKRVEDLRAAFKLEQDLELGTSRRTRLIYRSSFLTREIEETAKMIEKYQVLRLQDERRMLELQLENTEKELQEVSADVATISKKLTDTNNVSYHLEELFRQINKVLQLVDDEQSLMEEEIQGLRETHVKQIEDLQRQSVELSEEMKTLGNQNRELRVQLDNSKNKRKEYEDGIQRDLKKQKKSIDTIGGQKDACVRVLQGMIKE